MTQTVDWRYSNEGNPEYEARLGALGSRLRVPWFLDELRPGYRVLDVGSGHGTITREVAEVVGPSGQAVGLEYMVDSVERATRAASDDGLTNITFHAGSAYEVPYPDATFDVVCAFSVLFHLDDPLRALREALRALKPGGWLLAFDVCGLASAYPEDPDVARLHALENDVLRANGGDPAFGLRHGIAFRDAGFERIQHDGRLIVLSAERLIGHAMMLNLRYEGPNVGGRIVDLGLATRLELQSMQAQLSDLAKQPGALRVEAHMATRAFKPA